jgi:hypothetical protein
MTGYFPPSPRAKPASRRIARSLLRFGPSLVSLSTLIWATHAGAQTSIDSGRTTPVATSTASPAGPSDINITANGSVQPPSGVAVTIDSNNSVTNSGTIQFQNVNGVTGVQALGGHTGNIVNNNAITVTEDTSSNDANGDGILDGPFATGANRIGIQVTGPAPFVGSISNAAGGVITVQGNNSYAISVETALQGTLSSIGTLSFTGAQGGAIRAQAIGGDVQIAGTVTSTGQGAQGITLGGDVAGGITVNGTVTSTGYRSTTRSIDPNVLKIMTPDELLQGGTALTVSGSVGRGLLIDSAPVADANNPDANGDGIPDASETGGNVSSFGQAPAVVIGSTNSATPITFGNVGTGANAYGMIVNGSILGSGVYDGVSATALQIGVPGGGAVNLGGGLHVTGTIQANAYANSATAINIGSGVTIPVIRNDGIISAVMSSDAAGAAATGIVIGPGSNVTTLLNSGAITANVAGQVANGAAVVDQSGSITEIENVGAIGAGRTLTDPTVPISGSNVALDLRANTTGVHLLQSTPAGATGVPSITGAVMFGSGSDRVEILGGSLLGDMSLGAGANALTVDGGATVAGALTAQGGTVALAVGTGSLSINSANTLNLTSLHLGATSQLIVTADPVAGTATALNVAGDATIDSGAKIGVRLSSILQNSATYTIIRADHLTAGSIDTSLLGSVPFLYTSSLQSDIGAGTVSVTLNRKTATDLNLPKNTAGEYEPLIQALNKDAGLESAFLAQTDRAGLVKLYNQMLPNYSGSIFQVVSASVAGFSRPIDERVDPVGGGFWVQETNVGLVGDSHADQPGYKAYSLGLVGGYELPAMSLGIFGLSFGGSSGQIYDEGASSKQNLTANILDGAGYWRTARGPFSADARLGADYLMVSSDRVASALGGDGLDVTRIATGHWHGIGVNARANAAYEIHIGDSLYVRPQVNIDYFRLEEGSYKEKGGGDAMNLAVDSRTSSTLSGFAGVALGAVMGEQKSWGPELLVGYRDVATEKLGATTAHFESGGDAFSLQGNQVGGSGVAAHLALKGENGAGGFALETGAEMRDDLAIYDLRLSAHFQF